MPLILAIEPDPRQAAQIAAIARNRVGAELMMADTTEGALDVIGDRVPDLVLVPALLSPQDDAALAAALRVIAAAAHVRTLTIPVLSAGPKRPRAGGMLAKWRRGRSESPEPDGCDPAIFAEQISVYLKEAAAERAALETAAAAREPAFEAAPAAYAVDPARAVFADETPHTADAPEMPQAAYALETPQVAYAFETPQVAYAFDMLQATSAPEPPQAASEPDPPQAASEPDPLQAPGQLIAPVVAIEERSIVFQEPRFFVEEPAAPFEETRVVSAEPVRAEQEPTLASPAPMPVVDETLAVDEPPVVEERVPASQLTKAAGRDVNPAETPEDEAEEELVFELTLDDADVTFFDEPAPVRIHRPAVNVMAGPPVASEGFTADERALSDLTSLNDYRSKDRATIEEFSAGLTATPDLHAQDHVTADLPRRSEHWMPMSSGIERLWPPLEGVLAEFAEALELLDQVEVTTASASSVDPIGNRHDARADKVLQEASMMPSVAALQPASLVQRAAVPPAAAPLAAVPPPVVQPLATAPPPAPVDTPKSEWVELIDSLRQDIERLRSTPPQAVLSRSPQPVDVPSGAVQTAEVVTALTSKRRAKAPHPIQDEWGFFDPEQCGFAALLAKLDEMTDGCDEPDAHAN